MRIFLSAALALAILAFSTYQTKIFIGNQFKTLSVANYQENLPITIKFVHSVQKTPVIEELVLKNGEFLLTRTKYQSQGVGLPFDISDGSFYRDNDWFIFDMNRKFQLLELRTGKGTQLTLSIGNNSYELYKIFPVGTKIIVKII